MAQLGRKIYYELATGNVICDTGERAGDVVETTQDQDFAMYSALQPYQQSAVGVIQLNYGDYAQNFVTYPGYHIDIMQTPHVIAWEGTTLSNAQAAKIAELESALANAIETFPSSALGAQHTYLADQKSMAFLNSEYMFVIGPDYDQSTIDWYTLENGMQTHTGAQIRQVFLDGRTWVKNQEVHKDDLTAQVNAATTVDAVNAITW